MQKYDCLVIGAGIIGASCAMNLAKAGYRVAVLEKDQPCKGATGACNGGISYLGKTGEGLWQTRESLKLYQRLDEELGADLEIDQSKSMILLGKSREDEEILNHLVQSCNDAKLPAELLSGAKLKSYLPQITSEVKYAAAAPGGLQGVVNPFKVTLAYLEKAQELGAEVLLGRNILGINKMNGKIKGLYTGQEEIYGEMVINCAGTRVDEIWAAEDISLGVYPIKGIVLVSDRYPRLYPGNILNADFMKKNPPEISLAIEQTMSGNLLIGACKIKGDHSQDIPVDLPGKIAENAMSYLADLNKVNIIRAFSGHRPGRDGGYYIGKINGWENLYGAAGFGGSGITMAPWAGKKILEEIKKG